MNISANPEKEMKGNEAHPSLGNIPENHNGDEQTPYTEREVIEGILNGLESNRSSLTIHIKALNGLTRGAYRVTVKKSAEWNEITVTLRENTMTRPVATGFVDCGHTSDSRREAAAEVRDLVRAYLCR